MAKCIAGCKVYTGNEKYHHKNCPHYPESFSKRFDLLKAENKRLRDAIKNVPTSEYDEAQKDGCDASGAWDCFLEALEKWEKQALENDS